MRKCIVIVVCLFCLCGCGVGSMNRGNLNMEQALIDMADLMRKENVGALMNEKSLDGDIASDVFGFTLEEADFAYLCSIRQDIWQEAAIFHCNDENWSIIKESAQARMEQALQYGTQAYLGTCGDYIYLLIGEDVDWMRSYLEGLS